MTSVIVVEARSSKSRCQQAHTPSETLDKMILASSLLL